MTTHDHRMVVHGHANCLAESKGDGTLTLAGSVRLGAEACRTLWLLMPTTLNLTAVAATGLQVPPARSNS